MKVFGDDHFCSIFSFLWGVILRCSHKLHYHFLVTTVTHQGELQVHSDVTKSTKTKMFRINSWKNRLLKTLLRDVLPGRALPQRAFTVVSPEGYDFTFVYTIKCSLEVMLGLCFTYWQSNKTRETQFNTMLRHIFLKLCDLSPQVNIQCSEARLVSSLVPTSQSIKSCLKLLSGLWVKTFNQNKSQCLRKSIIISLGPVLLCSSRTNLRRPALKFPFFLMSCLIS